MKIAVGGDSAGSNLAAVVCLNARSAKSYMPKFQWLIYPATNMNMVTASHTAFAEGYFLTRALMSFFQGLYLSSPDDKNDWRASPLLADSLGGLPPALIQTAGFDPLKDEGKAYADRMNNEGSNAQYTDYEGMVHGFVNLGGVIDKAGECVNEGVSAMRKALS